MAVRLHHDRGLAAAQLDPLPGGDAQRLAIDGGNRAGRPVLDDAADHQRPGRVAILEQDGKLGADVAQIEAHQAARRNRLGRGIAGKDHQRPPLIQAQQHADCHAAANILADHAQPSAPAGTMIAWPGSEFTGFHGLIRLGGAWGRGYGPAIRRRKSVSRWRAANPLQKDEKIVRNW